MLSVGEHPKKDDLRLNLKPAAYFRESDALNNIGEAYEQKYFVHASDDSQTGIDVIKLTYRVHGQAAPIVKRHFTKAMKSGNAFAPIYARRLPDLSLAKYVAKSGAVHHISMGSYEPNCCMPFIGVFVANRDREFIHPPLTDIGVAQCAFRRFRIVMMWSYWGPIISNSTGQLLHYFTLPIEELPTTERLALQERFSEGFLETDCIAAFRSEREYLKHHFINLMALLPELAKFAMTKTQFSCNGKLRPEEWRGDSPVHQ